MYPPGLPVPHETSSAPVLDSGVPGSVGLGDEDMTELVPVLLAQGRRRGSSTSRKPVGRRKRENILWRKGTGRR